MAPVLIAGNCKTANTVALCLLLANQQVVILSNNVSQTGECLNTHAKDIKKAWGPVLNMRYLAVTDVLNVKTEYSLAIAVTKESLCDKRDVINVFENVLSANALIAVNTESIELSEIQQNAKHPGRIIGANWVEPAHTTYFLEIISNNNNDKKLVNNFAQLATQNWKKDPYIVNTGKSIRARLMCAIIREAFYLVENGYVSFEDIDRACRNDAGYYLPFAGNFRYMDLMGTYIYGLVMKDMNPDLTKQHHVPQFFKERVQSGSFGMESNRGIYDYQNGEVEKWNELQRNFSYQVREIIDKYHSVI